MYPRILLTTENKTLGTSENRVPKRMFVSQQVTGAHRTVLNVELHNVFFSKYYSDQVRKNKMCRNSSTHWGMTHTGRFLTGNKKRRGSLRRGMSTHSSSMYPYSFQRNNYVTSRPSTARTHAHTHTHTNAANLYFTPANFKSWKHNGKYTYHVIQHQETIHCAHRSYLCV
jgi:hypothetical protein